MTAKYKKSPIRNKETFCSVTGVCDYHHGTSFEQWCRFYHKKLGEYKCAARRLPECTQSDPVWKNRFGVENKVLNKK